MEQRSCSKKRFLVKILCDLVVIILGAINKKEGGREKKWAVL